MFLPRQLPSTTSARSSNPTTSEASIGGVSAADLIQQAENHWDVSATSILAAWVATMIGILLILLLYSTVRLKWCRIYLPRWKLRKPSQTKEEKQQDKLKLAQLSKKGQKEYLLKKFKEEPDYYPGFDKIKDPDDEKGYKWVEAEDDGIWYGKVPKASITFFGWMRASWEDTKVELMAVIPKWFCCCWSVLGLRFCVRKRGQRKRKTILEQDIQGLKMLGLDAVIYLMFLRLLKYLFATISILAVFLAFANYYINTETTYGSTNSISSLKTNNSTDENIKLKGNMTNIIDNPNLLTAANITSNGLLVHVSFEIIVTMLVIIYVLKACTHHARLVKEWAKMNRNEISFKSLFITNLSILNTSTAGAKKQIKDIVLGENLKNIHCEIWFAVHKLNPLEKRIEKFKKEAFSKAIEAVAMETFYEGQEGQRNHMYDTCWDRVMGRTKVSRGFQDEALKEKYEIEEVQELIRYEQNGSNWKDLNGTVTAAFVTLPTASQARTILFERRTELAKAGYELQKAPRTHNVLWKNLEKDAKAKHSSAVFGKLALLFVCFLNTFPVMGIVFLTNIGIAIDRYPKLAQMQEESQFWKIVFMILEGVLPATVAAIFAYFLPYIMRELNRWSGSITRGQLDKDQIRQVFIFLLVSNFVVFGLIGVLYETISGIYSKIGEESIEDIYKSIGDLPAKITGAYISQSLYWFSWYPIRSIVMWLQLLQVPRLILKTPQLLKFKTPQDLAEVTLAIHFEVSMARFFKEQAELLKYFFTAAWPHSLIYAPLAPVVVIGATIHFWSAHIVHSQSLKFVNDTKETDGECWWVIINRLLVGTVFMQCLMVLTVTLKTQSPPMAVAAALPIFLIVLFKLYLNKHYKDDNLNILYNGEDFKEGKVLEKYVPDVLRYDWMPKGKTVKNRKLMDRAKQRIPALEQLMKIDRKSGDDKPPQNRQKVRRKKS
uniref:CSC1/OSCA1-like 7TM region domain-containing protein n=1 Tax=Kwoniella bestiolae CBS 10118 TaxID=1296100 RepID=A0A1B9G7U2_9TREE|nr:hypothetical protein I302_01917 [Kwoniella bestiolae CBS 10118]OCF27082.1 hypothetical protein I302_01917 [Kwoniella bestiolae CBS 10118]